MTAPTNTARAFFDTPIIGMALALDCGTAAAEEWIAERRPDWKNPSAYWDVP